MKKEPKIFKPLTWVPSVYFAMGLPFITLSLVSVLIFKDLGIEEKQIAFWTSLLILPWSFKPLFSLVMEAYGTKKKYVVLAEILTAVTFGVIVFVLPLPNSFAIVLAFMGVIALSGSVHDIAGDGIYMEQLDTEKQSLYSGWQGAFYNLAKVLTNGGLVFLAGWLTKHYQFSKVQSWQVIVAICGSLMLAIALYHIMILPRAVIKKDNTSFEDKKKELWQVFISFFQKKYIWFYLLFIFLYRFAEGLTMKIAPLFLVADVSNGGIGLTKEQYGIAYGTFGAIAFILGSILAGYYIARAGLQKVLFYLACAFNIPFVIYLLFALFQLHQITVITLGIVFEYFGYGFGFVGLILFMMQQIAPGKHQMAHYAFATSLMNLSVLVPGMISGYLSEWLGYKGFFVLVMITTIPAIIISRFVPFTHTDKQGVVDE